MVDGAEVTIVEETKGIIIEAVELLTMKVVKSDTTVELDAHADFHSIIYNSFMEGQNKAPLALLSSPGQVAGEQEAKARAEAEAKARAEAEAKAQAEAEEKARAEAEQSGGSGIECGGGCEDAGICRINSG